MTNTSARLECDKVIYCASKTIIECLRYRGYENIRRERNASLYVGFFKRKLIKLGFSKKIEDKYSIEYHREKRKNYQEEAEKFFNDGWSYYTSSYAWGTVKRCRELLKLAQGSGDGFVTVGVDHMEDISSYIKSYIPEQSRTEYSIKELIDKTEICDDQVWEKLIKEIESSEANFQWYDEVYEK